MARGHRVLVVDDDDAMGAMLVDVLRHSGFEAAAVHGVDEAMAELEQPGFTLVVSDVQMHPRDGLDLLETVRQRAHPMPVILMSAFADHAVERRALAQGAWAFLSKPFDPGDLIELVGSIDPG